MLVGARMKNCVSTVPTAEPHWQRLEGHHEGATEGEDSQELHG